MSSSFNRLRRPLGLFLLVFAVLGLVASGLGAFGLVRLNQALVNEVEPAIGRIQSLVVEARSGLDTYDSALGRTAETLAALESASGSASDTLEITDGIITSVNGLLSTDLPAVLADTDTALESAGRSAGVIDFVLGGLNTIAGLTGVRYEPTLPLSEAIGNVQNSLTPIQQSLTRVSTDLETARQNLTPLRADMQTMGSSLGDIRLALEEGRAALEGYDDILLAAEDSLAQAQVEAPRLRARTMLVLSLILLWLAVSQLAFLAQGAQMVAFDPQDLQARLEALEAKVK